MSTASDANKAKIARRVIEVLEFFDETKPKATVMDIVHRFGHPQSSTSELLASLVEVGLLYRDASGRCYSPTPRVAAIGAAAQPAVLRDGRLYAFMDRLASSTRHTVALFGMVGLHVQIFRVSPGSPPSGRLRGGATERPIADPAGLLLLSTYEPDYCRRALWRLNAEAGADGRFDAGEVAARIAAIRRVGHGTGASAFAADLRTTAMLLPRRLDEQALALGVLYPQAAAVDADALLATLRDGVSRCAAPESSPAIPPVARAAAAASG